MCIFFFIFENIFFNISYSWYTLWTIFFRAPLYHWSSSKCFYLTPLKLRSPFKIWKIMLKLLFFSSESGQIFVSSITTSTSLILCVPMHTQKCSACLCSDIEFCKAIVSKWIIRFQWMNMFCFWKWDSYILVKSCLFIQTKLLVYTQSLRKIWWHLR